ncbi:MULTISPECIES: glycosyltransferase family 2 protein [Bacillaceae]|uniref:Glycosyl transferase family 2 n=1 Tax=Oceanobacillus caeni TaxID=405946 RepID=A0ABR5MNJ4_9BACI|nr:MULTISPECIES: glycosyltransferase [Bacillaceae]KPH79144.1 glycosyl transferase family 2 [Oceanobacillus caeni]MED4476404.1 glycosyltransferase [Oceanobacillus caeni]
MATEKQTLVSIILPVKNEGEHIINTIKSANEVKTDYPFEFIIVDDASTDGCCEIFESNREKNITFVRTEGVGAAMARNVGAEHANGDYFIFCDAHLFFEDYWIDRLLEPIQNGIADATNPGIGDVANPTNVGYGYSWVDTLEPRWNTGKFELFPSPHLAGGCLAISKEVFVAIGGFERGFKVWGREDEEISLKLWLFGYKCYVVPDVKVLHVFRSDAAPFVLTYNDINYNLMRMAYSHFNEERIKKCKQIIKHSDPEEIEAEVLQSNVLEQREKYLAKRKYDDDWYMKKFNIPF